MSAVTLMDTNFRFESPNPDRPEMMTRYHKRNLVRTRNQTAGSLSRPYATSDSFAEDCMVIPAASITPQSQAIGLCLAERKVTTNESRVKRLLCRLGSPQGLNSALQKKMIHLTVLFIQLV